MSLIVNSLLKNRSSQTDKLHDIHSANTKTASHGLLYNNILHHPLIFFPLKVPENKKSRETESVLAKIMLN